MPDCPACGLVVDSVETHIKRHGLTVIPTPDPDTRAADAVGPTGREVVEASGLIVVRDVPSRDGGYL